MAYDIDLRRAKREEKDIIERFGINEPPVDPVLIARDLGLEVYFAKFSEDYSKVSGFYDCEDNAIYVNSAEYPLRQTFTVAHELGHFLLHIESAKSANYKVLMRDGSNARYTYEFEADEYDGNLLAQRFMLDKYWQKL